MVAGHGERAQGGAVIAGLTADHGDAGRLSDRERVLASELDRGLRRLGAAGDEEGAIEAGPGELADQIGESDVGLALEEPGIGEGDVLGLRVHGLEHAAIAVAEITDDGTGRGVEIATPRHVPEIDALAAGDRRPPLRPLADVEALDGPALWRVADAPRRGHRGQASSQVRLNASRRPVYDWT